MHTVKYVEITLVNVFVHYTTYRNQINHSKLARSFLKSMKKIAEEKKKRVCRQLSNNEWMRYIAEGVEI